MLPFRGIAIQLPRQPTIARFVRGVLPGDTFKTKGTRPSSATMSHGYGSRVGRMCRGRLVSLVGHFRGAASQLRAGEATAAEGNTRTLIPAS